MSLTMTRRSRLSAPVFIREPYSPENEFVRKDTFDAHMQRIETLIKLNMAEQKAMNESLNAKIDNVNESLNAKIDGVRNELKGDIRVLQEQLNHAVDTLTVAINRNDTRIEDMHQSQTKWFMLLGVLVAVIPIAFALLQGAITK